jgi:hypothetical protein
VKPQPDTPAQVRLPAIGRGLTCAGKARGGGAAVGGDLVQQPASREATAGGDGAGLGAFYLWLSALTATGQTFSAGRRSIQCVP